MRRKLLTIIIILATVSLIAAIITQLFWVRDAWQLKEDQFNGKVNIALKSVVNQLMTTDDFRPADPGDFDSSFYLTHEEILMVVNPIVLDSLLHIEFNDMGIEEVINYGVYRNDDQELVLGNYSNHEYEIYHSLHQISLTCLCQDIAYTLSIYLPQEQSLILSDMIILPVMSGLFLLILILSFIFTLYTLFRQKKLSDLKTDFVNNMTHEFKTPIATISISSEMLSNELVYNDPEKVNKYAQIIFQENSRLKNQVEKVLQIALMDRDDFKMKIKEWDAHEIIQQCINNYTMQVHDRNGVIIARLDANLSVVKIDKEHFGNIINNLLDNANKYSPENPFIEVLTKNSGNELHISIIDHGIGIRRENQAHVFKKFHRLQTGDIHNVKGFGLGLYYVKSMIEEMGGNVELKSEPGRGTTVILVIPM